MKNLQSLTFGLLCFICTQQGMAQNAYSGVFHSNIDTSILIENLSWQDFQDKDKSLASGGFKLTDLEFSSSKEEDKKFHGVWIKDTTSTISLQVPGWDSLVQMKRKMVKKGYLMTDIEAWYGEDGREHFVCLWEKKKVWHKVWKMDTWDGVVKKNMEMVQQFLYLRDVEAIQTPKDGIKFVAIYHEGDRERKQRAHMFASTDLEAFNTDQWQRKMSGYHMIDFEIFEIDGKANYLGIYRKSEAEHVLRQNFLAEDFKTHLETLRKNNFRLVDIEIGKGAGRKPVNKETALEQN